VCSSVVTVVRFRPLSEEREKAVEIRSGKLVWRPGGAVWGASGGGGRRQNGSEAGLICSTYPSTWCEVGVGVRIEAWLKKYL
jgi:hypothetical protein